MKKNYELIGMKLTYDMGKAVSAGIAEWNPTLVQDGTVNEAKELACRAHLGYVKGEKVKPFVCEGADWAVEYFTRGDTRKWGWYRSFFRGLLLCLVVGDKVRIQQICTWAKPTKKPDYNPILPDEVQLLYLCLAGLFQEKPAKQFATLAAKVAACRIKDVRLLSRALDAVTKRDQAAFQKAILDCVQHQKTKPKPKPDAYFMEDWLPLHANTIFLAGLQLGMKRPQYPAEVMAYLMTPESVGFGK